MPNLETATVIRVIDGDTVVLHDYRRIRLLGYDSPESHQKFGPEATRFAIDRLLDREIQLEYDAEILDIYGRTLAYIWVDGYLFNVQIVRHGLGVPMFVPPNGEPYKEQILMAQQYAAENQLGMYKRKSDYPNNLIDEIYGRKYEKFNKVDFRSFLFSRALISYVFEAGVVVPMYINMNTNVASLTLVRWWRLTKRGSLEINDAMDILYDLINAYNKLDEVKSNPRRKILFTPNYPKWLFDDSEKAEPNVTNRIVTYVLRRRQPGSMSGQPFRGKKEMSPSLREEFCIQNEFGELENIEVWGQWFDNMIKLECWAPTPKEAEDLAFTMEALLREYRGYILRLGVQKMIYFGRNEDFHMNIARWHCRSLNYYFRTENIEVKRDAAINSIDVEAMSFRNMIQIQSEITLNSNGG